MSFQLPLVDDGISYKKGKSNQILRDRKGFKKYDIIDGKRTLLTEGCTLTNVKGD